MTDATTEVETAETEAPAAKPAPVMKPCLCGSFQVGQDNGDGTITTDTTECNAVTQRDFAQGHDAKLASFVAKAEVAGDKIWQTVEGKLVEHASASAAVADISAALQKKVESQVAKNAEKATARRTREADRALARLQREAEKASKKEAREAEKATKKAEKEAAAAAKAANTTEQTEVTGPREVDVRVLAEEGDTHGVPEGQREAQIKVGRWEYSALIDETGTARFTDNNGGAQERAYGDYRELAAPTE